MTEVRLATYKDEVDLMEICRELHRENGIFPLNEDYVRSMLHRAFSNQGGIVGVIGEPGERLQGCIFLVLSTFWYSDQWHLEELFSFVRPEYRKSENAKNLISYAMECSDRTTLPLVIGVISNEKTEAKIRLYKRKLKDPIGAFFMYNGPEKIDGQQGQQDTEVKH